MPYTESSRPGSSKEMKNFDPSTIFGELASSPEGLSSAEANKRLAQYGPNALEEKAESPLLKFLGFFWGPIPWMIEVAALLSAVDGHWVDLLIILVMLVFNAVVGFLQEHQAANAVAALKKQLALRARVKRGGRMEGNRCEGPGARRHSTIALGRRHSGRCAAH
jgi:H+-transporting ATPase